MQTVEGCSARVCQSSARPGAGSAWVRRAASAVPPPPPHPAVPEAGACSQPGAEPPRGRPGHGPPLAMASQAADF